MLMNFHSNQTRLKIFGLILFCLLGTHLMIRYLSSTLFGFATYKGLNSIVPFAVLWGYLLLLVVLAIYTALRLGNYGIILGTGLLLLATEPFISIFLWGDGCKVGGHSGATLVPEFTIESGVVVLYTWNGACTTSINTALIGAGILLAGLAIWLGRFPNFVLKLLIKSIQTYWPF